MIIVRISEGLGNQMFEYAYAYAMHMRMREKNKNINVCLDMREESISKFDEKRIARPIEIDKFNISLYKATEENLKHWDYIKEKTFINKFLLYLSNKKLYKYKLLQEEGFKYKKEYMLVDDNTYIEGWFQQYMYFEKYRKNLLKEFTLKEEFIIPSELKKILEEKQVVSLHIRRGDYITNRNVRKIMAICGKNYYSEAVKYVTSKLDNPYIFIFTNDEKWVRDNLFFDVPNIVISNNYNFSDIQEMVLMSYCNHNIIANSTFSWWGAWLNTHEDKIVVAPKKWFLYKKMNNIAMKDWIKI